MKQSDVVIYTIILIGMMASATGILIMTEDSRPPTSVNIDQDATFSGYIDREGGYRYHSIRVYENVSRIHFVLKSPDNDFDLYGSYDELPSISSYDFRGYESGDENMYVEDPEAGIWQLMVHSYSGTGHYTLIIKYEY